MTVEEYCENGIHFVGDDDDCWRCELWERQKAESRVFYAAVDAHSLRGHLRQNNRTETTETNQ